jgi:hypothetical protein
VSFARAVAVAVIFVWLGMVLAIVILLTSLASPPPAGAAAALAVAFAALALQLAAVRPRLNRRSDKVLVGLDVLRSRGHYVYVGLEAVKTLALAASGILLLSS